jgi:hypothetical protein
MEFEPCESVPLSRENKMQPMLAGFQRRSTTLLKAVVLQMSVGTNLPEKNNNGVSKKLVQHLTNC